MKLDGNFKVAWHLILGDDTFFSTGGIKRSCLNLKYLSFLGGASENFRLSTRLKQTAPLGTPQELCATRR